MKLLLVAFFLLAARAAAEVKIPNQDQIWDAYFAIEELIENNERLGAKFLRLAFHDCVSPTCDGCINMATPDNGGLQIPIDALESVYMPDGQPSEHSEAMSRADFWALAGIVGVEWAIETANNDYGAGMAPSGIVFTPGRTDCANSPNNVAGKEYKFPSAHLGSTDLFKYFRDHFGLSQYETVALMGAHTIGRATKANTGFDGVWTGPTRSLFHFDGTYHHILLVHDYGWTVENIGTEQNPKYQWNCEDLAKPLTENRDCGFMLDADVATLIDLKVDAKGKPLCKFFTLADNTCGIIQENYDQMYKYDSSFTPVGADDHFVTDFAVAFTKVINRF